MPGSRYWPVLRGPVEKSPGKTEINTQGELVNRRKVTINEGAGPVRRLAGIF